MKSFLFTIMACALLTVSVSAQTKKDPEAALKQGKKEAEALVKKAITYYRSVGKDKALLEMCDPRGKFVTGDMYVTVYDNNGKCLAHGANLKMVGKDWSELKDADGKAFIKERTEMVKSAPIGWQTYKWTNPLTKQIEPKTTYVEKAEEVIFACGTYKK